MYLLCFVERSEMNGRASGSALDILAKPVCSNARKLWGVGLDWKVEKILDNLFIYESLRI